MGGKLNSREASIQCGDQLVNRVLRRVEHDAGADDFAVEAAFDDQHVALSGLTLGDIDPKLDSARRRLETVRLGCCGP